MTMPGDFFKRSRVALAVALAVVAVSASGSDSILWWMVGNDVWGDPGGWATVTKFDGTRPTVNEFVPAEGESLQLNAARVRAFDQGGDSVLLYLGGSSATAAWLRDEQGNWTGLEWTQASLGELAGNPETYSFLVELGHIDEETDEWFLLAQSGLKSYASLAQFISNGGVSPPAAAAWNPSYVVPEPSGALLSLVGLAMLALRRRRT